MKEYTIAYLDSESSSDLSFDGYEDRDRQVLAHPDVRYYTLEEFSAGFNNEEISDLGFIVIVEAEEEPKMRDFVKDINFELLKKQKLVLLEVIKNSSTKQQVKLNGILHLIDAFQDTAVDKLGYKENEVFKLTK